MLVLIWIVNINKLCLARYVAKPFAKKLIPSKRAFIKKSGRWRSWIFIPKNRETGIENDSFSSSIFPFYHFLLWNVYRSHIYLFLLNSLLLVMWQYFTVDVFRLKFFLFSMNCSFIALILSVGWARRNGLTKYDIVSASRSPWFWWRETHGSSTCYGMRLLKPCNHFECQIWSSSWNCMVCSDSGCL